MSNPDLQNYITQSHASGMTDDQIRQNLVGQGWDAKIINQNMPIIGKFASNFNF